MYHTRSCASPLGARPCATDIQIALEQTRLDGDLRLPEHAEGIVVFVHAAGSSRHSVRDRNIAIALYREGIGTLQFDLRTMQEESLDRMICGQAPAPITTAQRLIDVTHWLHKQPWAHGRSVGYFGTGSGASAALIAAERMADAVTALVCCDGSPAANDAMLARISAATLLLVDDQNSTTVGLNRHAMTQLACEKELVLLPCTHTAPLGKDAQEHVTMLACTWFRGFLAARSVLH